MGHKNLNDKESKRLEKIGDIATQDAEMYHYRPKHKGKLGIKFKKTSDKEHYDNAFSGS